MRLLSVIFLVLTSFLNAKTAHDNWKKIYSDEATTILLSPSKIIGYGNEISVWAIEEFNKPKSSENGEVISKTKTHYLFNKIKKRYAEIGVIYYNSHGKILDRSSKSNFQGSSAPFMSPIKSKPNIEIIYKEAISFLITGNINAINENGSEYKSLAVNEELQNSGEIAGDVADSASVPKEDLMEVPKIEENLEITEKPEIILASSEKPKEPAEIKIYIPQVSSEVTKNEYNSKNERALANAIFTDGNLYCIQVSSWKTKAYADRELNKLLSDGFDAFIVSVKPANKRSIWHRVRVGYFSSLKEAKAVKKKIGKR
jgi:hypothetical protein